MNDDEAREQLTRLWLDHKNAVEKFVRRRCLDRSVDDIVQEVFMIAWRRMEDVPDEPRPWLLTVARHVISNRNRADQRHDALALRLESVSDGATASAEDRGIERAALKQGWAGLTDQERETLSLVAWDQLTGAEAAQVLGITRGAFAVRLMRARRHLARLVDDDPSERCPSAAASSASVAVLVIPPALPLALAGVESERTSK